MRDYIIATDSCCDFDENLIRELDLTVIPLSVHLGQDHFRNYPGEMPESHVFYTRLSKGEPAQTSAPNVEAFKDAFRPFLEAGKDVLYLGFSSALSATYQNAAMAVEELREAFPDAVIRAVDTLCASMGQGLLVDLAVQEKRKGKSLEEVASFVQETIPHLCHWFTVGDLSQLRRGGRLSAGKAIVGNLLNIKPVLHVDHEGRLVPMESAKGRKKSVEALVRHMEETAIAPETQRIYISHGDCLGDAEVLAAAIQSKLGVASVTIGDVGPVIGAHAGLGTLALFFLGKER
ncbi:DegV family protein [Evtepia sp.]|jgi:DegV family protein with EDD domain|uniref:DegV family protein n=1 Tax=Evtepia sp. TaxID=2773933 RepID=UPI003990BA00